MSNNDENPKDIIMSEIQTISGPKKSVGNSIMIRCPFHTDKSPSLGIFTGNEGKIPFGFFSCFGCSEKGDWNKLARKLGLRRVKSWANYKESPEDLLSSKTVKSLLSTELSSVKSIIRDLVGEDVGLQKWPKQLDWRGYDGSLIRKLGGIVIDDSYTDNIALFLPVVVRKQVVGGFKANLVKEKGRSSYINSKGDWVQSKGLFPFDHVRKMLANSDDKFVILVEGPRDALRLIVNGIPAISFLGANNFSSLKALLVASLDIDIAYIMTDNDEGGDIAYARAKSFMKHYLPVKRIKLPKSDKKIDPGNMPQKFIDKLEKILRK